MAEYYNVTTNLGDAEIANAIATNTKLDITHVAFGDGNGSVPTPTKTRTSLVREVHRQAVTKYERHPTNANWIVIETIIPSDVGGFTIREMGIIANGKLISHGSHAPFEKVADPSGVSEYRLRFTQNVTDGSVVEIMLDESLIYASQAWVEENFIKRSEIVDNLTTNDSKKPVSAKQAKILQDNKLEKNDLKDASTEQKGVVELATIEEAKTGINDSKALTPKSLRESYVNSLQKYGYSIRQDGFIEQWGLSSVVGDGGNINIRFPINFPNLCFNVQVTENAMPTTGTNAAHVTAVNESQQGFNLYYNSSTNTSTVAFWRAIGK